MPPLTVLKYLGTQDEKLVRRQARTQSDPASKRGPVPEHRQGSPFVLDLPQMLVLDEKPTRFTSSQRMSSKRNRVIQMPAPYLRRIWLEPSRIENREAYLARFSPLNVSSLTPVTYSGFRWATQIDPIWNAHFLACVLALLGEDGASPTFQV